MFGFASLVTMRPSFFYLLRVLSLFLVIHYLASQTQHAGGPMPVNTTWQHQHRIMTGFRPASSDSYHNFSPTSAQQAVATDLHRMFEISTVALTSGWDFARTSWVADGHRSSGHHMSKSCCKPDNKIPAPRRKLAEIPSCLLGSLSISVLTKLSVVWPLTFRAVQMTACQLLEPWALL